MDTELQHIVKDLRKAYGVRGYFTDSGVREGLFRPYITLVRIPNDVIAITDYYKGYAEFTLDLTGAYDEFSKTTYLYCPRSKYLTKICKGKITFNGICPIKLVSMQSLLLNIRMRRI
jgi:hypothetical protein